MSEFYKPLLSRSSPDEDEDCSSAGEGYHIVVTPRPLSSRSLDSHDHRGARKSQKRGRLIYDQRRLRMCLPPLTIATLGVLLIAGGVLVAIDASPLHDQLRWSLSRLEAIAIGCGLVGAGLLLPILSLFACLWIVTPTTAQRQRSDAFADALLEEVLSGAAIREHYETYGAARSSRPTVIFLAGMGAPRAINSALAADVAAHGTRSLNVDLPAHGTLINIAFSLARAERVLLAVIDRDAREVDEAAGDAEEEKAADMIDVGAAGTRSAEGGVSAVTRNARRRDAVGDAAAARPNLGHDVSSAAAGANPVALTAPDGLPDASANQAARVAPVPGATPPLQPPLSQPHRTSSPGGFDLFLRGHGGSNSLRVSAAACDWQHRSALLLTSAMYALPTWYPHFHYNYLHDFPTGVFHANAARRRVRRGRRRRKRAGCYNIRPRALGDEAQSR